MIEGCGARDGDVLYLHNKCLTLKYKENMEMKIVLVVTLMALLGVRDVAAQGVETVAVAAGNGTETVDASVWQLPRMQAGRVMKADSLDRFRLLAAGECFRTSAKWEYGALLFVAASGVCYSGVVFDRRRDANLWGTVFVGAAAVAHLCAIRYRWKGGRELMISSGKVTVSF